MHAADWISRLKMQPHPEGGYFCTGYSGAPVFEPNLPGQKYSGVRRLYSSIIYLLGKDDFSAFHRLETDEMWHHYEGGELIFYILSPDGSLTVQKLGKRPGEGAVFQFLVPHHHWFAVVPAPGCEFALCGCTLSPGYDEADFEMACRDSLRSAYPEHAMLINSLTRQQGFK